MDKLFGGAGSDYLHLNEGPGDDLLSGGSGDDVLGGRPGR